MRRAATPGELRSWGELLAPCPLNRIGPIKRLLSEVVADCPVCEEPIRRCDARRIVEGQLQHLPCAPTPLPEQRVGGER